MANKPRILFCGTYAEHHFTLPRSFEQGWKKSTRNIWRQPKNIQNQLPVELTYDTKSGSFQCWKQVSKRIWSYTIHEHTDSRHDYQGINVINYQGYLSASLQIMTCCLSFAKKFTINKLALLKFGCNSKLVIFKLISSILTSIISCEIALKSMPQDLELTIVNNIGSGYGLVLSDNEPLSEPIVNKFYDAIWHYQATMS